MKSIITKLASILVLLCCQQLLIGMELTLTPESERAAQQLAKNEKVSIRTARLALGWPAITLEQARLIAKSDNAPIEYVLDRLITLYRRGMLENQGNGATH